MLLRHASIYGILNERNKKNYIFVGAVKKHYVTGLPKMYAKKTHDKYRLTIHSSISPIRSSSLIIFAYSVAYHLQRGVHCSLLLKHLHLEPIHPDLHPHFVNSIQCQLSGGVFQTFYFLIYSSLLRAIHFCQ